MRGLLLGKTLSAYAGPLLDLLMPAQCGACGRPVAEHGALCPACWAEVRFLSPPWCACCGLPFPYAVGEGALCAACAARPPAYERARAAVVYDDVPRRLIVRFKHSDRLDLGEALTRWLSRAGAGLVEEADVIVPVPLHPGRLFRRKYNQAAVLAQSLAKRSGLAYEPMALLRQRATPAQGGLRRAQRWRNVRGAFTVPPEQRPLIADQRVLLIDDVFTTGATAQHASLALLRAGASAVDVLSLARVVLPHEAAI